MQRKSTDVEFHCATECVQFTFTAYPYEKVNFRIFSDDLFLFCITFYFLKNQHVQCFCTVEYFLLALCFLTNNVNLKKKSSDFSQVQNVQKISRVDIKVVMYFY